MTFAGISREIICIWTYRTDRYAKETWSEHAVTVNNPFSLPSRFVAVLCRQLRLINTGAERY